jgi:hypothetical protein
VWSERRRAIRLNLILVVSPLAILLSLFGPLAASAGAATYTVKQDGTGDFTTIQACATAMSAGGTCTVYAGTYDENVIVTAGTSGNYNILTVNPGDTVYVLSFTIGSYTKINGFYIQNPSSPHSSDCVTVAANSNYYYITNNNFYACGSHAMIYASCGSNEAHGFILGNTLSYSCSTSSSPNTCTAMEICGDYVLIDSNDISHVSDGPYIYGKYDVLRNNKVHDTYSSECGSNSSNCHIDFMQADAPSTNPSQHLLIEGNTAINMELNGGSISGSGDHGVGLFQAEACNGQCFYGIVRFHLAAHIADGGILDDNSETTSTPGWSFVKAYSNTWADVSNQNTGIGNGINGFDHGSSNGSDINDIFYFPFSLADFNPYECGAAPVNDTSCTGFNAAHNLGYCTSTPCNLRPHTYGTGSWTDDPGNILADPMFVNYAGNNFNLSAGSPAIGAGTSLTTVANSDSGSGTSLVVNDAGFFQDGSGIATVQPDWIRVGPTTTVQIASINYNTNTLTLANPISRSPGDPVYLYKNSTGQQVLYSSAPDIGAYQYCPAGQCNQQTPPPPSNNPALPLTPRAYPNPWRADRGYAQQITFDQLAGNTTIKIFTVSGHLVRTLGTSSSLTTWDLNNDSGDRVASGIYIYLVTDDQGQQARGKVVVIR